MRSPDRDRDAGEPAWHVLDLPAVAERLGTGPAGLAPPEAERRLAETGPNDLPAPPDRSLASVVLSQLRSPLIALLVLAALLSVAVGAGDDAIFIAVVLAINTAIGAAQEWKAQRNTAALRSTLRIRARVRRAGAVSVIDAAALVPGDVVLLEAGDRVPADLRLTGAAEAAADEAALTGESLAVDKVSGGGLPEDTPLADRLTMLHAGSVLVRGTAEAIVVATGAATAVGGIAGALAGPAPAPPLTRRLEQFSWRLGGVVVALVGLVMAVELLRGSPWQDTLLIAVALAVSAIPEGLPVAVTVALSAATRRMARRQVIVRNLPAVEGLGACTVVATDKTGTLTVNQLTARRLWLPQHGLLEVEGAGFDADGGFRHGDGRPSEPAHAAVRRLGVSGALCNDATILWDRGPEGRSGDAVDLAFLVLAAKAALDVEDLRAAAPRVSGLPFSAERKLAATVNRHEDGHALHVKGAAEVLIPLCGNVDPALAASAAEELAATGHRVLAVATKPVAEAGSAPHGELHGLTLLGLVGFIDPLRPEAREAVARCRRAGVAVKMITGDHGTTALAIARDLGIATDAGDVLTGAELARLSGEEAARRVDRTSVFARVEPSQKVAIVEALKAVGHVVAMTGDGVNDAPALSRADLGVAMGRGGTDVAREAADLVLADDDFSSIVAGIEEGRAAYANIRKVIWLLVSTGAAEIVLFLAALAAGLPAPLTAVQLLWLNLVTNGGQDVALAFERREPGLLDRPPRPPRESLFDRRMIAETLVSGLWIGLVGAAVFGWLVAGGMATDAARNVLLFLLVAFENVHVFNCRSEERSAFGVPLSANRPLLVAVVAAQGLHIGAAYVPGLSDVLGIAPIDVGTWIGLAAIALSVLAVSEGYKALVRRSRP